jgi:hypothetical protein
MRRVPGGLATGAAAVAVLVGVGGCGAGGSAQPGSASTGTSSSDRGADAQQRYPDVEAVEATRAEDGTLTLAVTLSSPYDSPERYADGWRVLTPDGTELAAHTLGHDHANEQPFTRTQQGVEVPDGVTELVVEGRDLANGYGGSTVTVEVPRS